MNVKNPETNSRIALTPQKIAFNGNNTTPPLHKMNLLLEDLSRSVSSHVKKSNKTLKVLSFKKLSGKQNFSAPLVDLLTKLTLLLLLFRNSKNVNKIIASAKAMIKNVLMNQINSNNAKFLITLNALRLILFMKI
jgi:hypothetical protein